MLSFGASSWSTPQSHPTLLTTQMHQQPMKLALHTPATAASAVHQQKFAAGSSTFNASTTAGFVMAKTIVHVNSVAPITVLPQVATQLERSSSVDDDVIKPIVSSRDFAVMEEASQIFKIIDVERQGSISKLDLLDAVQHDANVDGFVIPNISGEHVMTNPACFDAVDTIFESMAGGRKRVRKHTFVRYFRKASTTQPISGADVRELFEQVVVAGVGCFSRFDLVEAVQKNSVLAQILLPAWDCRELMNNSECFDAIDGVFDDIAGGKPHATFEDFDTYIQLHQVSLHRVERSSKRVLIIGPGYETVSTKLLEVTENAGYQLLIVDDIPDPDQGAPVQDYLGHIKAVIDSFQPQLIASASKGGKYLIGLWQARLWTGPSLMINVHPSLEELPQNVPIVLAHGSNDSQYRRSRESLERLASSGTANMCFLYYSGSSGRSASWQHARLGDAHFMQSLLAFDLLPRLMDAAMSRESPETHMLWSSQQRLSKERLDAEQWLGYCPKKLRQYWASADHQGRDDQKLYEVSPGSQEFNAVAAIFHGEPREASAYLGAASSMWNGTRIRKVERVENGLLEGGSAEPYYESLRQCIEEQGLAFEEGVHTRWGFHGTDAVDSIILDPLTGFQPLASGSRLGAVWGSGTYFARDAQYSVESNFSSSKKMLLCLLMTGVPCLGDPAQRGILPFRQRPHRYNSAVDSLSSPEVFVLHHPGAAYPAYLISFA
jgi:hypothetical protein